MELEVTHYAVADRIATITLSRPHRHNAWTGRMHTEYRSCLARAAADDGVRALVVTGDPDGAAFCVGADTAALGGHVARGGYDDGVTEPLARPGYGVNEHFDADFAHQFGLGKPIVAALNGPAAGVGLAVACFADLRYAVPGARLTTAHGRLNLPAEYGLSWQLPRLVGGSRAVELLLSSRVFTTDEAHDLGLVHHLSPPDELLDRVHADLVDLVGSVSAGSLAATKHQLYADWHRSVADSVRDAQQRLEVMMTEPDFAEGVAALTERRRPDF